jgi:hypothetical protein
MTRNSDTANAVKRGRECLRNKYWSLDIIVEAAETGYAMDSLLGGGGGTGGEAVRLAPRGDEPPELLLLPLLLPLALVPAADAYATASPADDEFLEGGGDSEVDAEDLAELPLRVGSMMILDSGVRNLIVFFLESGESSSAAEARYAGAPLPPVGSERCAPSTCSSTSSRSPVDDEVRRKTCD